MDQKFNHAGFLFSRSETAECAKIKTLDDVLGKSSESEHLKVAVRSLKMMLSEIARAKVDDPEARSGAFGPSVEQHKSFW